MSPYAATSLSELRVPKKHRRGRTPDLVHYPEFQSLRSTLCSGQKTHVDFGWPFVLPLRLEKSRFQPNSYCLEKTMKFTGLILICATSCLALILPAIGVVQFPKVQTSREQSIPSPASAPAAPPQWSGQTWNPANPMASSNVMPNGSYPVSTNASQAYNPAPSISPLPSDSANDTAPAVNKFGLGIWLLLVPVCLLGLAMWTFGPNPSGAKPRFAKQ